MCVYMYVGMYVGMYIYIYTHKIFINQPMGKEAYADIYNF